MQYTVQQLALLAGVSVRTLHYYDEIGLLTPRVNPDNQYRQYSQEDSLKLQQILFFKELEFSLDEIKEILSNPSFDRKKALQEQKKLLQMKQNRLQSLIATIEITITKGGEHMTDDQKFAGFSTEQMDQYKEEAKTRWGHTDAWKQSQERTKNWTKADYERIAKEGAEWTEKLAELMRKEVTAESKEVQEMIDAHYNSLRTFYEPNPELYRGLAEMYISDERFTAYYDKHEKGLAKFMHDAMVQYVEKNK